MGSETSAVTLESPRELQIKLWLEPFADDNFRKTSSRVRRSGSVFKKKAEYDIYKVEDRLAFSKACPLFYVVNSLMLRCIDRSRLWILSSILAMTTPLTKKQWKCFRAYKSPWAITLLQDTQVTKKKREEILHLCLCLFRYDHL